MINLLHFYFFIYIYMANPMDATFNVPVTAPVQPAPAQPMEIVNHLMVPQGSMGGPNEATTARFTPWLNMREIIKSAREKPFHSLEDFDRNDKIRKQAADAGKKRLEENKRKKSREPTMAPPRFDVVKRITEIRTLIQIYKDNLEIWKGSQDNKTIKYYKEKIMNLEKERSKLMNRFIEDGKKLLHKNRKTMEGIKRQINDSRKRNSQRRTQTVKIKKIPTNHKPNNRYKNGGGILKKKITKKKRKLKKKRKSRKRKTKKTKKRR